MDNIPKYIKEIFLQEELNHQNATGIKGRGLDLHHKM